MFFQISPEKIVREPREDPESDDEEENGIVVAQQEAIVAEEVPVEIEVEELVEREVMKDFMEERRIPQVKALYTYKGQGMKVEKGEVRFPYGCYIIFMLFYLLKILWYCLVTGL